MKVWVLLSSTYRKIYSHEKCIISKKVHWLPHKKSFTSPVFDKTQEITKETDDIYRTNTIVESSNKT